MLFKNFLYRLIQIIFVFVCVIIINNNQMVAQWTTLPCVENLAGCTDWQSSQRTILIVNCPVTFQYNWRSCPNPNCPGKFVTQMYIYNLFWFISDQCETFTRRVFPNWPNTELIHWSYVNAQIKNAFRQITILNFLDMYNQTPTEPPILRQMLECEGDPCQQPDNCEGSVTDVFEGWCESFCLSYSPIGTGGDGKVYINIDDCIDNRTGCCKTSRSHCYCKAT